MEPSAAECQAMTTLRDVATWAGLKIETSECFTKLTGLDLSDHFRVLAVIDEQEYIDLLKQAKVKPTTGSERPPTLKEYGQLRLVSHVSRHLCGLSSLQSQSSSAATSSATASTSSTTTSTVAKRKIKASQVLSQLEDEEIIVEDEKIMIEGYLRYEVLFGAGNRPKPEHDVTLEQLSAVKHLRDSGVNPYLDFAIWGPYSNRIIKRIKLSGVSFSPDGTLRQIEMSGPATAETWSASYKIMETAFLMLDMVDLGKLNLYREKILGYATRYGQNMWHLIYQGDVRCRSELFQRLKVAAAQEHAKAVAAGLPHDYKPDRPWNFVLQRALEAAHFWKEEIEDPALIILTKTASMPSMIQSDILIGNEKQQIKNPLAVYVQETRVHEVNEKNEYVKNRKGRKLCVEYNKGNCDKAKCHHVHSCSRCLGPHAMNKCPHTERPETTFERQHQRPPSKGSGRKGGGKQRQQGKGKGYGKRFQY